MSISDAKKIFKNILKLDYKIKKDNKPGVLDYETSMLSTFGKSTFGKG